MSTPRLRRSRGMALLMALLAVAVMGLVAAQALQVGAQASRRDAEEELLHVGGIWRRALRSWVDATPGRTALGPRSLDELLRDPRAPGVRRHLRQVPHDPLTGRLEWGLQRSPDGQITGVHSLAEGVPIKRQGFAAEWSGFADAKSYTVWVFGNQIPVSPSSAASGPR